MYALRPGAMPQSWDPERKAAIRGYCIHLRHGQESMYPYSNCLAMMLTLLTDERRFLATAH